MAITSKKTKDVETTPLVATGLTDGWLTTRETGVHPLGSVILGAAGAYAVRAWNAETGALGATGLIAAYLSAFGLSHPLAKKINAWPSVLTVTALAAGAAAIAGSK